MVEVFDVFLLVRQMYLFRLAGYVTTD